MKLGHNVCLEEISYKFEKWLCYVKNLSLGQIIEEPMLVTLLFNAIPHKLQGSDERPKGHHGPLDYI